MIWRHVAITLCLSADSASSALSRRQHPSRLEGPFLHGPVWAGAPEASCGQPPAICRPLLQGWQPYPKEWRCQAAAGSRCCHPGASSTRSVRHRPGETGDWERPAKEASANGRGAVWMLVKLYTVKILSYVREVSNVLGVHSAVGGNTVVVNLCFAFSVTQTSIMHTVSFLVRLFDLAVAETLLKQTFWSVKVQKRIFLRLHALKYKITLQHFLSQLHSIFKFHGFHRVCCSFRILE